ncbi:Gldg family protein [Synechococcus sp. PCC 6312]|uniref:GldG family protein n=1 Tax=Synechococcus sp. (strain ATCC 27167 / PCC 6312) TaxID=195253 RepID=UPI00029EF503|nr:Gldg family protein [Synechococcus sp. PCC 6312]AFY61790.1 ABC-type uncharacterized transport system involved in gliding motility, auxiliary component [Synechococcus sp. PCC 6312]
MKRLSLPRQFNPQLLGVAALFLLIMGIAAGIVSGSWGLLPILLLGLAGGLLLAWLVMQTRISPGFWGRRSTQTSANNLLSLIAVLALLGILNFLGVRYGTQFDLTENQQFTLALESQEVLKDLKQPVNILVFESNPPSSQRLLLEQFQRQSQGNVSFQFIDPTEQPGLAKKFNIQQTGEVILESGNRSQPLEGELKEANLTPALVKVTGDQTTRAYFTQGHGELPLSGGNDSLSQAVDVLNKRNIQSEPLNLLTNPQVPADANVVIVAGPRQRFLAPEVRALEAFLKAGGSVLLMLDPDVDAGLEPLLNAWGVKLDNRWIIDGSGVAQQVGLGPDTVVAFDYGTHPITQKFAQGPALFPKVQAVLVAPNPKDTVVNLVSSSPQTWAESNSQAESFSYDANQDQIGPLALGVAITRELSPQNQANGTKPEDARLIVFGDSGFASNSFFEQGINGDLFVNSILWLGERDDQPLSIRPKDATNRRLSLSVATNRWVILISILLLPLLGFGLAVGAWWQRR